MDGNAIQWNGRECDTMQCDVMYLYVYFHNITTPSLPFFIISSDVSPVPKSEISISVEDRVGLRGGAKSHWAVPRARVHHVVKGTWLSKSQFPANLNNGTSSRSDIPGKLRNSFLRILKQFECYIFGIPMMFHSNFSLSMTLAALHDPYLDVHPRQ